MSEIDEDFFAGKRSWSIIKDQVLQGYMTPYIAKVNKRGKPILLIDGYAGPGTFGDGTVGSPLIMCQAAEKYAQGNYQAIFINKDQKYHDKLREEIRRGGWSGSVETILGDSTILLQELPNRLSNWTVFLYLDPFGLKGCEFSLLKPFLDRNPAFSTEILFTMNMPIVHRLAARHVDEDRRQNDQTIKSYHERLTKVFGGEYWKEIMWQRVGSPEEHEHQLIGAYQAKLAHYLPYTGSCPVREGTNRRIKYFIVFASRHPDSMLLLNDIMAKAYFDRMHQASYAGTLFANTDWRETRSTNDLQSSIINMVAEHSGETRKSIWLRIVQAYFMRYLHSEYLAMAQRLIDEKKLISPTPRPTKRLNDDCVLYLP
ncbi:MAG: three-Cys-motif partner protein TcmP [Chloroflexota bacterium]|nr:three-Cys-motif partner protein TcmP [Chloroflexota bacterium]